MRKLIKYGLIGLSALFVWKIFSKVDTIGKLLFKINKAAFTVRGDGLYLTFFIGVTNNQEESILINNLKGSLLFNGEPAADFFNDMTVTVPGNNITTYLLTVVVSYADLGGVILSILEGTQKKRAEFTLKGTATIENIPIPFNINYLLT